MQLYTVYKNGEPYDIPADKLKDALSAGGTLDTGLKVPIEKDGEIFDIPGEQVVNALNAGGSISDQVKDEKPWYKQVATGLESFVSSVEDVATFGLSKKLEQASTELAGRKPGEPTPTEISQQEYPGLSTTGKLVGMGIGPGGAAGKLAGSIVKPGTTLIGKLTNAGVTGATEAAVMGAQLRGAQSEEGKVIESILDLEEIGKDLAFGGSVGAAFNGFKIVASSAPVKGTAKILGQAGKDIGKKFGEIRTGTKAYESAVKSKKELEQVNEAIWARKKAGESFEDLAIKVPNLEQAVKNLDNLGKTFAGKAENFLGQKFGDVPITTVLGGGVGFLGGGIPGLIGGTLVAPAATAATQKVGKWIWENVWKNNLPLQESFFNTVAGSISRSENFLKATSPVIQKMTNISSKAPVLKSTLVGGVYGITDQDIESHNNYVDAIANPKAAYEAIKKGQYSKEYIETLKFLYPDNYEKLKADVLQDLQPKIKLNVLSEEEKMLLKVLGIGDWSEEYNPVMQQQIQQLNTQQSQPQIQAPKSNQTSKVSTARAGKLKTTQNATQSQQTAYSMYRK